MVAERYHTRHTERTVDASDVVPVTDRLNWHYDEPFGDYSSVPTYYLCREARQSITVALSGDGADELFAGYRKYQRLARRAELNGVLPRGVAAVIEYGSWPVLPIFTHMQTLGNVVQDEMMRTFNMGIGMLLVVPSKKFKKAESVLDRAGEKYYAVGRIVKGERKVTYN
jgi:hypothetical protein